MIDNFLRRRLDFVDETAVNADDSARGFEDGEEEIADGFENGFPVAGEDGFPDALTGFPDGTQGSRQLVGIFLEFLGEFFDEAADGIGHQVDGFFDVGESLVSEFVEGFLEFIEIPFQFVAEIFVDQADGAGEKIQNATDGVLEPVDPGFNSALHPIGHRFDGRTDFSTNSCEDPRIFLFFLVAFFFYLFGVLFGGFVIFVDFFIRFGFFVGDAAVGIVDFFLLFRIVFIEACTGFFFLFFDFGVGFGFLFGDQFLFFCGCLGLGVFGFGFVIFDFFGNLGLPFSFCCVNLCIGSLNLCIGLLAFVALFKEGFGFITGLCDFVGLRNGRCFQSFGIFNGNFGRLHVIKAASFNVEVGGFGDFVRLRFGFGIFRGSFFCTGIDAAGIGFNCGLGRHIFAGTTGNGGFLCVGLFFGRRFVNRGLHLVIILQAAERLCIFGFHFSVVRGNLGIACAVANRCAFYARRGRIDLVDFIGQILAGLVSESAVRSHLVACAGIGEGFRRIFAGACAFWAVNCGCAGTKRCSIAAAGAIAIAIFGFFVDFLFAGLSFVGLRFGVLGFGVACLCLRIFVICRFVFLGFFGLFFLFLFFFFGFLWRGSFRILCSFLGCFRIF